MRSFFMIGLVAVAFGTLLAPLVVRFAHKLGFVDRPDGNHKRHRQPIPLGGGLLVFLSMIIALAAVSAISPTALQLFQRDGQLTRGFVWSSLLLLVIGVVDDLRGMRGRHKLIGQIVAAMILTAYGLEIRQVQLLGWTIDLGVMAVPFTIFWLLGAINALNLLDGIDGMAGTIGFWTALLIACASAVSGQPFASMLAIALAGGCLAFLHVNLPPARMYLGDTGSMLIGLFLGGLTALSCSNGPGLFSIAPAVGLLALPIFDSTFALFRRRLTGRSMYMTDRGHLHHCLLQSLGNHHLVLLVASLACLASGVGAVASVYMKNDVTALVSTLLMVTVLVAMGMFGYAECRLFLHKLKGRSTHIFRRCTRGKSEPMAETVSIQLQGHRNWNLLWSSLTEWADKLQLLYVELDINLPAVRESFHANWHQPTSRERHECWQMELPLFVGGRAVGRLSVRGDRRDEQESICNAIDQLIELLEPFEQDFMTLASGTQVHASAQSDTIANDRPKRRRVQTPHAAGLDVRLAIEKSQTVSVSG